MGLGKYRNTSLNPEISGFHTIAAEAASARDETDAP
jgi:hypothetical protein